MRDTAAIVLEIRGPPAAPRRTLFRLFAGSPWHETHEPSAGSPGNSR